MIHNIDSIIEKIYAAVESHRVDEGKYVRWLWQNDEGSRELGINEYGCADAANILYSIGRFPETSEKKEAWIASLQAMQHADTGLFTECTHHPIHTTAHCIAALELFDAKPVYPLTELMKYTTKEGLYELLEGLDWLNHPWPQSHQGAGIYASMVITESVDSRWVDDYFDWFWENANPQTGMWQKNSVAPAYQIMAGSFHYLFNHEHAHRPLRYPERFIDSMLDMYYKKEIGADFGAGVGFIDIDWVYCVNRATRQTSYKFDECKKALAEFADTIITYLNNIDVKTHENFNDLHMLFGTTCCLAELQQALPGLIRSTKPLKLVLDRRPFI